MNKKTGKILMVVGAGVLLVVVIIRAVLGQYSF